MGSLAVVSDQVLNGVVAIVAGAIGYFVVLRASSFAAHALSHIGFAGAAGAVVITAVAAAMAVTAGLVELRAGPGDAGKAEGAGQQQGTSVETHHGHTRHHTR